MEMLSWCSTLNVLCVSHAECLALLVGHDISTVEDSDVANGWEAVCYKIVLGRSVPKRDVLRNHVPMDGMDCRQDTMFRSRG